MYKLHGIRTIIKLQLSVTQCSTLVKGPTIKVRISYISNLLFSASQEAAPTTLLSIPVWCLNVAVIHEVHYSSERWSRKYVVHMSLMFHLDVPITPAYIRTGNNQLISWQNWSLIFNDSWASFMGMEDRALTCHDLIMKSIWLPAASSSYSIIVRLDGSRRGVKCFSFTCQKLLDA